MTTAAQLIDKATGLIGVRAIGQTLNGSVTAECLGYLQMMLDAWRLEPGLTRTEKVTFTIAPPQDSYTISDGGDIDYQTPQQIISAYTEISGTKYNAEVIPENTYDDLDACTSNIPDYVFFDGRNLKIYPTPSAAYQMTLTVKQSIPEFPDMTMDVPLNAGMELAITSNLAVFLAPVMEKQASPTVTTMATNSKRALKNSNFQPAAVDCPVGRGKNFDIIRGY